MHLCPRERRPTFGILSSQAPVLAASAFFSTGFAANGDVIGPTLNVVPLNESKSVAVLSYPAEQEAEVTAALTDLFDADEKTPPIHSEVQRADFWR